MDEKPRIRSLEELKKLEEKYEKPQPSNWSRMAVVRVASEIAQNIGFKPGDDIFDVVKANGGRIRCCDVPEWADISGTVFIHGKKDFDIVIPTFTGPLRDKFTIAHELGHYVLHTGRFTKQICANRGATDRAEWEANWFATGFLMPEKLFKEALDKFGQNPVEIASYFGVSQSAAEIRIKTS
jgi:hypothetical protein